VPTNLLAHHHGVLERAGLLLRTPSSVVRRRRYVRLRRERLADLHLRTPTARGRSCSCARTTRHVPSSRRRSGGYEPATRPRAPAPWLHWSIPDPAVAGTDTAFDDIFAALDERIATLTA
jgi:hypothetical protein